MLFNKENNALVRASRQALKNAEAKAEKLKIKNAKLERLIIDIAIVQEDYFMLQMQDTWDSSDYRYADELKEEIKKIKEERKND